MLKKRIAALIMTAVISLTAVNFFPEKALALASETDALEIPGNDTELYDLAPGTAYVRSTSETWSDYVNVTGTERQWNGSGYTEGNVINPSGHRAMVIRDAFGNTTIGYCMQSAYSAPSTETEYHEGYRKDGADGIEARKISGAIALARFSYGGTNADPNADAYGQTKNENDGGTYGTYIISDGSGVKAVRGLMIAGKVYPMSAGEARMMTSALVHYTTDHSVITSISGKEKGDVQAAFSHLKLIADAGMSWYDTTGSLDKVAESMDGHTLYKPYQSFTWEIYNPARKVYEPYTQSDDIPEEYVKADGTIDIRVSYRSHGMCNNLTSTNSTATMNVSHTSKLSVGNQTEYFDYFKISGAADNSVPFSVSFSEIGAEKEGVTDAWAFGHSYERDIFTQSAVITVKAVELKDKTKKLSVKAETETGAAATPYKKDGAYAARMYHNEDYQDCFLVSPSSSLSASSQTAADMKPDAAKGIIRIHKYSSNPEISDDNACYSYKGATFGIFLTRSDAAAATEKNEKAVTVITTDKNGDGEAVVPEGTYYIKETKSPKGFRLNKNIYQADVNSDTAVKINVPETPENDPVYVILRKKSADKDVFLEGAVFTVRYYDVQSDTDPAEKGHKPKRTWYIRTDKNGYANINKGECILPESDELYYQNKQVVVPIGTITIQETEAPEGYILDDTIHTFVITDNPEGIPHVDVENERTITNEEIPVMGIIKIEKTGEDRHYDEEEGEFKNDEIKLSGIKFGIYAAEDIYLPDGTLKYKKDTLAETIVTDKNGKAASGKLPLGCYRVHEENTPEGYIENPDTEVTLSASGESETITDSEGKPVWVYYRVLQIKNKLLVPEIHTKARDSVSLGSTATALKSTTLTDTISYSNFLPGRKYTIETTLMDRQTGQPLIIDGKRVTGKMEFTPPAASGSVDVSITFDASGLPGKSVTFYERIYYGDRLYALHEDINDEGQTITFTPDTPGTPDTPKTGDSFPVLFAVILLGASFISIITLILIRKRIKQ